MSKYIICFIVIISLGFSFYAYSRIKKGEQEKDKKEIWALFIGQLIPLFALVLPIILPQEGTKVFFPEMEKKIEETKQLQEEIKEKDKLISEASLTQKKANEKIDNLNSKNYADLKKVNLVEDGLKVEDQISIALVNDSVYVNDQALQKILSQDINYDEDSSTIYIGGKGNKVSKEQLSDDYSLLYSGQSYKSFGSKEHKIPDDYTVAGKELTDGFVLESSSWQDSFVLIRLDDKYSSVEFDVSKSDVSEGSSIKDGKLIIELDGTEKYKETVNAQIASQHYQFDTTGAKTLKIDMSDSPSEFSFYNVIFNKA